MNPPDKQKFMQVKEKLDHYRLPTSFPYEATNIIHKLLTKIQQKQSLLTDRTRSSYKSIPTSPRNHSNSSTLTYDHNQITKALQHKLLKLVMENNRISRQLTEAKEYIEMLKQCKQLQIKCDSLQYKSPNKNSRESTGHYIKNEVNILRNGFEILKAREIELFEQLTQVKYKYNELMDLLHEDPNVQKQYIKRLLKHKKYELNSQYLQEKQKQSITEKYFKSQTVYGTNPDPQKYLTNQINKLQADNYKLQCLNRTLKHKLQNRELQILQLQTQLIDQFNVQGLVKLYQLDQKDIQIATLNNQVQILLEQLNLTPNLKNDPHSNNYQTNHRSKEKTVQKKKQILLNNDKTTKNAKSPNSIHINIIKSPPKLPEKTIINKAQTNHRAISKQRNQIKAPQQKDQVQVLKKENEKLKSEIDQLKTKIKKDNYPALKKNESQNKQQSNDKASKTVQQLQAEINILKKDLSQKQGETRKMEMRWKNVQEQNRIIIEQLSQKRRYLDDLFTKNRLNGQQQHNQAGQTAPEANNQNPNNVGKVSNNMSIISKPSYNANPTNQHHPPTSPRNNNTGNKTHESKGKSPFSKKSPSIKPNNDSIKQTQGIKTTNLQSTNVRTSANNFQTTNTNLLSTHIQSTQKNFFNKDNQSRATPGYSPSEYAKSQNNALSNKVYSEKINIDLASQQNDSSQYYPSNIHSKISSQKDERQSKKSQKVRLPDIQQEESLEKSHHSQEEARSRHKDNYNSRNPYNMPGIKISIKHNSQSVEEKYYDNQTFNKPNSLKNSANSIPNQKNPTPKQQQQHQDEQKTHLSEIQMKNYYSHHPQKIINNNDMEFLQLDQSDKDSVFSMRKEIDQLKIENRKQIKTKKKLQKTLQQIEEQKDKLEDQILMLQAQIQQLQNQNKHHPNNHYPLSNSQDESLTSTAQIDRKLRQKIKQQDQTIAQIQQENVQTELQIRDKDSKIKSLQQKIESLSQKLSQLTVNIKKLDQENLQLKKEREKLLILQSYDHRVEGQNYNTIRKDPVQPNQMQKVIKHGTSLFEGVDQVLWLKKQIKTLQTKIEKYNQTVSQLNDYINMHRQEKEKLSLQKLNLQKENDYLKKKMLELERALTIQAQQMKRYRETFQL